MMGRNQQLQIAKERERGWKLIIFAVLTALIGIGLLNVVFQTMTIGQALDTAINFANMPRGIMLVATLALVAFCVSIVLLAAGVVNLWDAYSSKKQGGE